jgi:STE24 endopeptidase
VIAAVGATPVLLFLAARFAAAVSGRRRRPPRFFGPALHVALLGLYAADVLVFGWHRVVYADWNLAGVVLIPKLLVLMPYLACVVALWLTAWHFDRRTLPRSAPTVVPGEPADEAPADPVPWTLSRYLAFRARQHLLLFFAPALMALTLLDGLNAWRDRIGPENLPAVLTSPLAVVLPVAATLLILAPEVIRRVLPTRPLRPGPLRGRLEAMAMRVGFHYRDILVWQSSSAVVNALIMGIVPRFRYVLLSDGLLTGLSPRAIEAVFGHEVGHARRYHLVFLFLALLGTGLLGAFLAEPVLTWAAEQVTAAPDAADTLAAATATVFLAAAVLTVTVLLSRRFERQADLFAARSLCADESGCIAAEPADGVAAGGCPAASPGALCPAAANVMIDALTVVAGLAHVSPKAPSLLHGSIAGRQTFLAGLTTDPAAERRFERRLAWMKLACVVAAAAGVLLTVLTDWRIAGTLRF